MLDQNETEATQDNDTLFSEVQISGDVDESSSTGNTLDTDFRLSRLRRMTSIGRRTSSSLSRSNSVAQIEKVNFEYKFICIIFISKKKYRNFPA